MNNLFIDMDDVVADYSNFFSTILKEPISYNIWDKVLSYQRIYSQLPKTEDADILVSECLKFASRNNYNILFLTAVPRNNDFPWAFYDKVKWAEKYYPNIPVWFGPFSKNKSMHCTRKDILIDDRIDNINEWKIAGGIGILHRSAEDSIINLLNLEKIKQP